MGDRGTSTLMWLVLHEQLRLQGKIAWVIRYTLQADAELFALQSLRILKLGIVTDQWEIHHRITKHFRYWYQCPDPHDAPAPCLREAHPTLPGTSAMADGGSSGGVRSPGLGAGTLHSAHTGAATARYPKRGSTSTGATGLTNNMANNTYFDYGRQNAHLID